MSGNNVVIHIPNDDFVRLVSGVLGQSRTYSRIFDQEFVIDVNWIANLCHILSQRFSQNNAIITRVYAEFYFSSGRIVRVNGIENVISFADTRTDTSVGVLFQFECLVKFCPDAPPERQVIHVTAFSDEQIVNRVRSRVGPLGAERRHDRLSYDISTTNITLGDDLCAVLDSHFSNATVDINVFDRLIMNIKRGSRLESIYIALIIIAYMFFQVGGFFDGIAAASKKIHIEKLNVFELAEKDNWLLKSISWISDSIYKSFEYRKIIESPFPTNQLIFPFILISLYFVYLANRKRIPSKSSYVILNFHTGNEKTRRNELYEKVKWSIIIGGMVGFAGSIAASIFIFKIGY